MSDSKFFTDRFHHSLFLLFFLVALVFFPISGFTQDAPSTKVKLEKTKTLLSNKEGVLSSVTVGNLLYAITSNVGIVIFDITDQLNPKEVGREQSLVYPIGGVTKSGNFLYVCDNVKGVVIYDISGGAKMKYVGEFKTVAEAWAVQIDPSGKYAFVAGGKAGLEVWDISQPNKAVQVLATTQAYQWDWSWALAMEGNTLYVSDRNNGLKIFNVTSPTRPALLGQYKTKGDVRALAARNQIVFVADGIGGAVILDATNPAVVREIATLPSSGYVTDISFYNPNFIFVSCGMDGVKLYDISNLYKPSLEVADKTGGEVTGVSIRRHGTYAATANGLAVYVCSLFPILTQMETRSTLENSLLSFRVDGYDPDSSATTITLVSKPEGSEGFTYDVATRTAKWKPTFEQSGTYNFTFKISKAGDSLTALSATNTLVINVINVNRPPSLPQPPNQLTSENKEITFVIPEGSDPDKEDIGKLTYSAANLPRGARFDGKTRTFKWTPDYTQAGTYKIKFIVTDGNSDGKGYLTDTKEITLKVDNVNRPPVMDSIPNQIVAENSLLKFVITASDPDKEDFGKLKFTATLLPSGAAFDPATQTFTWTPNFEQAGTYKARFKVEDQGLDKDLKPSPALVLSSEREITIRVDQTNRPPVVTPIGSKTVDEEKQLTFTVAATDPDKEDFGKLKFVMSFDGGERSTGGGTVPAGTYPEGVTFDTLKNVFSWKPNYEQSGTYKFTFKVTDSGIDGKPLSDQEQITVTVNNVNRPPVMAKVADVSGIEDSLITFTVSASDPDREDAGKLKISLRTISAVPSGEKEKPAPKGKPVIVPTPVGVTFDDQTNTFSWKPNFDQSGTYRFAFKVTDASGATDEKQMMITVANKNRPPVLTAIGPKETSEKSNLTFKVEGKDEDKEDRDAKGKSKLVYSTSELPKGAKFDAAKQTFSWTPDYGQKGSYNVTFKVTDTFGATDSEKVTITVKRLNRKPVLEKFAPLVIKNGDSSSVQFKATDPDEEDKDKLVFTADNLPQGATLSETGLFAWKPTPEQSGKFTINLKVKDTSGDTDSKPLVITVSKPAAGKKK
jgi:hypothetical protein